MERIYLIGLPGSGKTTLGKELAAALNYSFLDLDDLIKTEHGSIEEIFRIKGENYFRKIEREALILTLLKEKVVIACGGGTPCYFNNMDWMKWNGKTVYLRRSIEAIIGVNEPNLVLRPIFSRLEASEISAKMEELLIKRENFYHNSEFILETNQHFKKSLAIDIESVMELLVE
jgi:shikimate kinase